MGGIAGMVHYRGDPPDLDALGRVSARLAHRGPDGAWEFSEGPACLALRVAAGGGADGEPVVTDDLVLLIDGRIYDAERLLRAAGDDAPLRSDGQALVAAWRAWKFEATDHIEGSFAAAIWNRRNQTLTLLRDRLGTRPLFWARSGPRFAFASELPALLEVPWVGRELAREHVAEYLSFRLVHAPRTLLRDVHQVRPAHWLRLNADGVQTRRYWAPLYASPGTPRPRQAEVIPALQEVVGHAVRRRLAGGVRAGLMLSGGLGSTAIASAARQLDRVLPSFTVSFADDPHPETPFAGRVARLLGMDHHEVIVGSGDVARLFAETVRALGHPIGNPAAMVQLALARHVREHVPVVLSGDGGEELLGGRVLAAVARQVRVAEAFARLPSAVRRRLGPASARWPALARLTYPPERWGMLAGAGGSEQFGAAERARLLADPGLVRPEVRGEVLAPFYEDLDTDPLNAVLHAFLASWLCEGSLVRADRTTALAGVELRLPLLDREVLALAASLPGDFKVRRGASVHTRWPLQAMLSGVLPPPLVNRPKRGMPTPFDGWLAGPGRLFMEEWCARVRANRHGLWNVDAMEQMRRSSARERGVGRRLWTVFMLEAWLELVVAA